MTFTPTQGPLDRASRERDVDELLVRVTDLERFPVGRWIYVGTYPTDPDTTPDSPAFQNSWENAGTGNRRLRFRRTNEGQTEIAGSVTGGTAGTVVVTLPDLYRVGETEYAASGTSNGGVAVWQLDPSGDLTYLASVATGGPGTDITAIHYDDFNVGDLLNIVATFGFQLDTGANNIDMSGTNTTFSITGDWQAFVDGLFGVFADTEVDLFSGSTGFVIDPTKVEAQLDTGATFTIYDSLGNPMFQMTEGSPDIHIPGGGNVIADL